PMNQDERSNYAEASGHEQESSTLLLAQEKGSDQQDVWYLDTGASNHMRGDKKLFVELKEGVHGDVTFGDLSKTPVKGKCKIKIFQKN
ncbi:hypothetical protein PJI17_32000, partial [Mycobacterium kansasii]